MSAIYLFFNAFFAIGAPLAFLRSRAPQSGSAIGPVSFLTTRDIPPGTYLIIARMH
jgi:hypothetical protein